jgi:hypothetical protein
MPSKKIKTETMSIPTVQNKFVKIPLAGVIVFSLLLAGSSFFAGAAWLKIKGGNTGTTTATTAKNSFAAVKNTKPEFDFFVMSFCPYGNQMEELLKPVVKLLDKVATIQPHYIFEKVTGLSDYCKQRSGDPTQCANYIKAGYFKTDAECQKTIADSSKTCLDEKNYLKIGNNLYSSLHGRMEANQDVREICAYNMNEDKTNWWTFVDNVNQNCTAQNADTCWEDQAKKAGFDTAKITECFNTQAGQLIDKEIALTDQYKVQGSPTLIVNGVTFPPETAYTTDGKGSLKIGSKVFTEAQFRTADAIKESICASFKKAPKECKTVLTDAAADTNTAAAANSGAGCAAN